MAMANTEIKNESGREKKKIMIQIKKLEKEKEEFVTKN